MHTAAALHPAPEMLHAFALGCLDSESARVVESHILNCALCSRQVDQASADGFVRQIRSALEGADRAATAETISIDGASSGVASSLVSVQAGFQAKNFPPELADHPRYRVLRRLGGGGMGDVFLAEHTRMERQVALKVMNPRLIDKEFALARFHQEVKAAARLEHPNIVRAYDADEAGRLHFLVMEFVEGTDLATYLREKGSVPWDEACRLIRQAALGLQHAHEAGMVHRDIKPHNLMLTRTGQVKVLDFGLSRFARESARAEEVAAAEIVEPGQEGLTLPGVIMGTADYMAPEQAHNARDADIRADIYSLGCTLYHLLTSQVPFRDGTVKEKVVAHLHRTPPSVKTLRPDVPDGLAKVVATMMAKTPQERYQIPLEVIAALGPFTGASKSLLEKATVPAVASVPAATTILLPPVGQAAHSKPRPRSAFGRGIVVAAALLMLGVTVVRIQTNYGDMIISAESPDVQIVVLKGGEQVDLIDSKTNKKIRLHPGDYELRLKGESKGLRLLPEKFTIKRNDTLLAKVEHVKTPKPPSEPVTSKVAAKELVEIRRFMGHEGGIVGASLSADGRYVLSGGVDRTVRVWDIAEGKETQVLRGHAGQVYWAELSPNGTQIVSGGDDSDSRIWDFATGQQVRTLNGSWVSSIRFSPDGTRVAASGFDGLIRMWDAETGREVRRFEGHQSPVLQVAFSPDGRWLASCSGHADSAVSKAKDFSVRLWDVASGKEVERFEGHTALVRAVAFSRDGRRLVSGAFDGTLRLWNPYTGNLIETIADIPDNLHGVALDSTGRRALGAGSSGTLHYWDLDSGKELAAVHAHRGGANSVAFHPDRQHAMSSAGGDGTVKIWRLPHADGVE